MEQAPKEQVPRGPTAPSGLAAPSAGEPVVVHLPEASRRFVRVDAVTRRADAPRLSAPARVVVPEAGRAAVGAPLGGRVVALHVARDASVEAGAPLVTLLAPEAAAARAQATAAEAVLRAARAELARQARMVALGVAPDARGTEVQREVAAAEAEVARARAVVAMLGDGKGGELVVRAPRGGTVVDLAVTVGAAVVEGARLVELRDATQEQVVVEVFERDAGLVLPGARVEVELAGLPARRLGRVSSLGGVVREGSRTVPVRVALDAAPGGGAPLRSGQTGRARIHGPLGELAVPVAAVLVRAGAPVVYVARGSTSFERRAVEVGSPLDGWVVIRHGLREGDMIAVEGALLLDGAADQLL